MLFSYLIQNVCLQQQKKKPQQNIPWMLLTAQTTNIDHITIQVQVCNAIKLQFSLFFTSPYEQMSTCFQADIYESALDHPKITKITSTGPVTVTDSQPYSNCMHALIIGTQPRTPLLSCQSPILGITGKLIWKTCLMKAEFFHTLWWSLGSPAAPIRTCRKWQKAAGEPVIPGYGMLSATALHWSKL